MARSGRSPASKADARERARIAAAYFDVAELVSEEEGDRREFANVAVGLAVLAGIAASDAISGVRRGQIHRGKDHREATELLRTATPDGQRLASTLARLLDLKDAPQYGALEMSRRNVDNAIRWSRQLVQRASDEIAR